MTQSSLRGGPDPMARAAVVSVPARSVARPWLSHSTRRLMFGYTLLAPAALYVVLLVGAPFLFSLYLAVSDANVGDPIAHFIGLENFQIMYTLAAETLTRLPPGPAGSIPMCVFLNTSGFVSSVVR